MAIASVLADEAHDLVEEADQQTALGTARLAGELERTLIQIAHFADVLADGSYLQVVIDDADPQARPAARPALRRGMRPVGPVAVWAASNFPFAFGVIGGDSVSALAAGCPVIVKAHPSQPALSERLSAAVSRGLRDAGAPDGAFSVVHGMPAGAALIMDRRIRAGAFTGSERAGRALLDLACSRPDPIPFFGELGSVNPVVVTPAAATRADEIAEGLVSSVTLGAGQFCTKPGIAFVPAGSGIREAVAQRIEETAAVAVLNGAIQRSYENGVGSLAALSGVSAVTAASPLPAAGAWVTPWAAFVSVSDFLSTPSAYAEECFGPAVVLVEYSDPSELVAAVSVLPGCLAAAIHGDSSALHDRELCSRLGALLQEKAGRLVWNGWPTGVAVTWAMQHGGPYPSSTNAATTSVGAAAITRFLRPVVWQGFPADLLPHYLRDDALTGVIRWNGHAQMRGTGVTSDG
jgi:NADP-dependent aldehyde dehydrogenase